MQISPFLLCFKHADSSQFMPPGNSCFFNFMPDLSSSEVNQIEVI